MSMRGNDTVSNPSWGNDPSTIVEPGTEERIVGPYFPRLPNTDNASFEAGGS